MSSEERSDLHEYEENQEIQQVEHSQPSATMNIPSGAPAFHVVHDDMDSPGIAIHHELPDIHDPSTSYEESSIADRHNEEENNVISAFNESDVGDGPQVETLTSGNADFLISDENFREPGLFKCAENVTDDKKDDVQDCEDVSIIDGVDYAVVDMALEKVLQADPDDEISENKDVMGTEEDDLEALEMSSETNQPADFEFVKPETFAALRSNIKESTTIETSEIDVEQELRRAPTLPIHLPETVYNIDEETRMSLDQTSMDSSMMESTANSPLPPKKLFPNEEIKDWEASDTDTKMSITMTDTEDIRLRHTISIDDATKDSIASDTEVPTPPKRSRRSSKEGGADGMDDYREHLFTAENLFEYQWPQDGGEWHLLQEQISEFLKVKSFKRKYPDLYRRTCDKEEKTFLRERGVVTETQSDLGLTALRSEEVYDLMMKDYNDKYREYVSVLQEKQKRVIREKHKEYSVQPKLDKSKIDAYSKKAARSAAEFNASLMRERKDERQAYFDLQTYTIHYPKTRFRTLKPASTRVGAYPVPILGGQFQDHYRKYSSQEMSQFPLKTSLRDPPRPVRYVRPPPAGIKLNVKAHVQKNGAASDEATYALSNDEELMDTVEKNKENENLDIANEETDLTPIKATEKKIKSSSKKKSGLIKAASPEQVKKSGKKLKDAEVDKSDDKSSQNGEEDGEITLDKMPAKIHGLEKCRICKQRSTKEERKNDRLVKCAECGKIGHMSCLDLTDELVAVIKTYPWQCMECKTCMQCMDPYDEDKMMFCDRCDRGYHTFCIGLNALPTGHWECRSCVGAPKIIPKKRPKMLIQASTPEVKDEIKNEVDLQPKAQGTNEEVVRVDQEDTAISGEVQETDNPSSSDPLIQQETKDDVPITSTQEPAVKIERRGRKRKNPDIPRPPKPVPERIQGARQSRRIKLRGEEGEERKKKKGEEGEERVKKKKIKRPKHDGQLGDSEALEVKKEMIAMSIETPGDGSEVTSEIVSEGVDDSIINIFTKAEDDDEDGNQDYPDDSDNVTPAEVTEEYVPHSTDDQDVTEIIITIVPSTKTDTKSVTGLEEEASVADGTEKSGVEITSVTDTLSNTTKDIDPDETEVQSPLEASEPQGAPAPFISVHVEEVPSSAEEKPTLQNPSLGETENTAIHNAPVSLSSSSSESSALLEHTEILESGSQSPSASYDSSSLHQPSVSTIQPPNSQSPMSETEVTCQPPTATVQLPSPSITTPVDEPQMPEMPDPQSPLQSCSPCQVQSQQPSATSTKETSNKITSPPYDASTAAPSEYVRMETEPISSSDLSSNEGSVPTSPAATAATEMGAHAETAQMNSEKPETDSGSYQVHSERPQTDSETTESVITHVEGTQAQNESAESQTAQQITNDGVIEATQMTEGAELNQNAEFKTM